MPLIVPLTVPHIVLHTVSQIVPNLIGQRVFGKLVITTDQGILEDAVAQTVFRAHGYRYRVGSTLKGEGLVSEIAIPKNLIDILASLESGQLAMNTVLGLMLDTMHNQNNLLTELADLSRDEPGPSPIMQVLEDLTSAVNGMDENLGMLGKMLVDLPEKIGAVIDGTT